MRMFSAGLAGSLLCAILAGQAFAQGTRPKENASQYYAHAQLDKGNSIGADFLGKFLPVQGGTIYSDEYIFVEVALFGPLHDKIVIQPDQFTLKVNGRSLTVQPPGMITVQGNFAEMEARPHVVVGGGTDSGEIEIGGAGRTPRFPGDDAAHTPRRPTPQAPTDASGGQAPQKPQDPETAVKASILPEGAYPIPVSGYLCFAFEGKLKKIKHAELDYKGPLGIASLPLR